jgi:hypothetical protein
MARTAGMDSPFLIKRSTMPPSPRAALKQLQPRAEETRIELVRSLRLLAKELEHEADEVENGAIRPSHNMIAPYAAVLDRMRAEANLLYEWTRTLRGEIVGPVTPYMGNAVIPSTRADVAAPGTADDEAGRTGPSIAQLMEQVAAGM